MKNQVQLCTYVDRLSGGGIQALASLLDGPLKNIFGSVHLLPFYTPIDGADAGFDPSDHIKIDSRLGDWTDLKQLTAQCDVMADVIVNHISIDSPQFGDYSAKGDASIYAGLFLSLQSVFPHGASEQELLALYRPRPGLPLSVITLKNGEKKILWTTFTSKQIDINVKHAQGEAYLNSILQTLSDNGVRQVRLDAVGYAIKKAGASSFMMPETLQFIDDFASKAKTLGLEVLVEIHSYYRQQIETAKQVDWVYDFALPPLVLHALFFNTAQYLKKWIAIRPNNAITVLDTHDGIGVIDIGADSQSRADKPGLVPADDLDRLVERIHANSHNESRTATGSAASNLDLYQVNCTFYDALGQNNQAYLLARAIQFFMPGVPQVYYVGLLAGHNDLALLARTGVGRDINRHYYSADEVAEALQTKVVKDLLSLIKLRNEHPAFQGKFDFELATQVDDDQYLTMRWKNAEQLAELRIDFSNLAFQIFSTDCTDSNNASGLKPLVFTGC
jgi:sucrose phosphorylase